MTSDPNIGIILPLFQGERYLSRTLDSVLTQTYSDFEIVVVDDGSTDAGPRIARSLDDPRIRVLTRHHQGIARTRNFGLQLLSPTVRTVSFLDQDDLWPADFLARAMHALASRPDAVAAAASVELIDPNDDPIDHGFYAESARRRRTYLAGRGKVVEAGADYELDQLLMHNYICPPSSILFRRAAVTRAGGFDASYQIADDWDLVLRVLRAGPILDIGVPCVGYRRHPASTSTQTAHNVSETRRVWSRNYYSQTASQVPRSALARAWRHHQRASARARLRRAWKQVRDRDAVAAALATLKALAQLAMPWPPPWWK